MRNKRRHSSKSAALALGLALGASCTVQAQDMTGPAGLSSGTGAGTGAGGFSGVVRSRSSSISGVGPTSISGTSGGLDRLRTGPRTGAVTFGPGVDVSFPNDPYLMPFLLPEEVANPIEGRVATHITSDLLENARRIADPAERSLALRQIANGAIASNQLVLAHHTLEEAITATSQVNVPLVRDQRLIGLVTSLTALTDALLRIGRENQTVLARDQEAEAAGLEPLPKRPESTVLIRLARLEWRRAVYLAEIIGNPTYRNEMLYRVAENEAMGSASSPTTSPRRTSIRWGTGRRGARPTQPPPVPLPPPTVGPRPAAPAPPARTTPPAEAKEKANFAKLADEVLVDSWHVADQIDRLIWKNRAMVRITLAASDSQQFQRGVELARTIRERRVAHRGLAADGRGTMPLQRPGRPPPPTYQAAAEAAASITQDGLRGVMVGFLVDSLIASGRFDDARACTGLYPEESERFVALGAVAESMGKRGLADAGSALDRDRAPPGYRSALLPPRLRPVCSGPSSSLGARICPWARALPLTAWSRSRDHRPRFCLTAWTRKFTGRIATMSTIAPPRRRNRTAAPPRPPRPVISGEQRIAIRGVSWDLYDRLSEAIDEHQHVRLAYDGKDLEIMSTSLQHEDFKELLGRLFNAITDDLRIPCRGGGQTTWKREAIQRGIEADLCYYFDREKLAIVNQSRARKLKDIADYPNPDLATEIDISSPQIDRPSIYAALNVAEDLAVRRAIADDRATRSGWEVCPGRLEPIPADPARGSRALGGRGEHRRSRGLACAIAGFGPRGAGPAPQSRGTDSGARLSPSSRAPQARPLIAMIRVRSRSREERAVSALDVPDAGVHDVEVGGDDEQLAAQAPHPDGVIRTP